MRTSLVASLVAAVVSAATAATARERAFRTADPAVFVHQGVSSQCTFKALQISGYRATAGERRICYFDCDGIQAAIGIPVDQSCARDQAVVIQGLPGPGPSPAGRTRSRIVVSRAAP